MDDFGATLRQARERKGISLRQIASRTRISASALEALERNDIAKLPGGIFSRAFVRAYAAEVGLDPEETLREFLARFEAEPLPSVAAVAIAEQDAGVANRQRMAAALITLVVVSLVIVAVILFFTLRGAPGSDMAPAPAAESEPPAALLAAAGRPSSRML